MKSLVTAIVAGCALAASGFAAQAASLVSGKKLEVNVNPDTLEKERLAYWDRFGPWCAIQDWHPAVKTCVESKEGDDVYRTLTLQDGGVIKEKLVDKKDGMSYRYAIVESPLPVKNYTSTLRVREGSDGRAEVEWSSSFDPVGSADEAAKIVKGIYQAGLDNLNKMLGG